LLLASGVGDPYWVGWGFTDHPHFTHAAVAMLRDDLDLSAYEVHRAALGRSVDVLYALGIPPEVGAAEDIPPLAITLVDDTQESDRLTPGAISPLLRRAPAGFVVRGLTVRMAQTPTADSRIGLSDRRDAFGMPLAAVDWKVPEGDREGLMRAFEILGAELGRAGLGRLWVPLADDGAYDSRRSVGCHHVGTTRMSTDQRDGVVDRNCRVHGLDNLFVAGSSVFREPGFANPTLTICALAHRLADHLRGA